MSFFAWKCREIRFRSPCLVTFLWISTRALKFGRRHHQRATLKADVAGVTHVVSLLDRLTHEVVKVVQPLPIKSPVQDNTDFGAGQTKLDVVHLVDHCVLGASLSATGQQETKRRLTLIITRITLTKPKTTLAGVILETSFARFMASMVAFNAEIVSSRLLGRWGSTFIVGVAAREL